MKSFFLFFILISASFSTYAEDDKSMVCRISNEEGKVFFIEERKDDKDSVETGFPFGNVWIHQDDKEDPDSLRLLMLGYKSDGFHKVFYFKETISYHHQYKRDYYYYKDDLGGTTNATGSIECNYRKHWGNHLKGKI